MGTPLHVLARPVLHRHLSPLWSPLGPKHLQQLCQRTSLGPREQLRGKPTPLPRRFLPSRPPRPTYTVPVRSPCQPCCEAMRIPVATRKCVSPATCITFLGIILDSSLRQLGLPPEKLQDISCISDQIMAWRMQGYQLSLIGKLSFAAKVVTAGRLFLRCLIQLPTPVTRLNHHIHLNPEARADLRWRNSFLPSWNDISMFLAPEWKDVDSFQLYIDASGSFGFGAYLDGAWFRGDWQPHQQLPKRSIQWQELFAI